MVQLIEQFATPDRKGVQRLEGNVPSMRIQKNPDSVLITDLNAIPAAYKHVTLTMPAYVWEALVNCVGWDDRNEFESRVEKAEYKPDKKAIAGGTQKRSRDHRRRFEVRRAPLGDRLERRAA